MNLSLEIRDPLGDLMHPLHDRLQPLGSQAELFAKRGHLAAAELQSQLGRLLVLAR